MPFPRPGPKVQNRPAQWESRAAMLALAPDAAPEINRIFKGARGPRVPDPARAAASRRNSLVGRAAEGQDGGKGAESRLRGQGYQPWPSNQSMGPWDVIGVRTRKAAPGQPVVRMVQVKTQSGRFEPSKVAHAVARFLGWPPHLPWSADYYPNDCHREVWLRYHGEWVADVVIDEGGQVSYQGPAGERIRLSVERLRASLQSDEATKQQRNKAFIERSA